MALGWQPAQKAAGTGAIHLSRIGFTAGKLDSSKPDLRKTVPETFLHCPGSRVQRQVGGWRPSTPCPDPAEGEGDVCRLLAASPSPASRGSQSGQSEKRPVPEDPNMAHSHSPRGGRDQRLVCV